MTSATQKKILTKTEQQITNKPLTENILLVADKHNISIRNLHRIYCEKHPNITLSFSTFYYRLLNYSFSETEYNRLNIILKSHEREVERMKKLLKV
jgi:predicted solute-binding protein